MYFVYTQSGSVAGKSSQHREDFHPSCTIGIQLAPLCENPKSGEPIGELRGELHMNKGKPKPTVI